MTDLLQTLAILALAGWQGWQWYAARRAQAQVRATRGQFRALLAKRTQLAEQLASLNTGSADDRLAAAKAIIRQRAERRAQA